MEILSPKYDDGDKVKSFSIFKRCFMCYKIIQSVKDTIVEIHLMYVLK